MPEACCYKMCVVTRELKDLLLHETDHTAAPTVRLTLLEIISSDSLDCRNFRHRPERVPDPVQSQSSTIPFGSEPYSFGNGGFTKVGHHHEIMRMVAITLILTCKPLERCIVKS